MEPLNPSILDIPLTYLKIMPAPYFFLGGFISTRRLFILSRNFTSDLDVIKIEDIFTYDSLVQYDMH